MPLMLDPRGDLVPRKDHEVVCWLALHGETQGGAWIFSTDGHRAHSFTAPKALCSIGDSGGGFERWTGRARRELVPVHAVSMPFFLAYEKKLVAWQP